MLIYLDEYRKAKAARALVRERYSEELLCVNSSSVVGISTLFSYQHPAQRSPDLPHDFTSIDVDRFVDRARALASQI